MSSNMSSNFTFLEVSPYYQPNVPEGVTSVSTLAQMEVGCTFSPSKLLAQEEIGPKPFDIQPPRKSVRFSPYQKPSSRYTPQPANLHSSNPQPLIEMTVEPESRHSTPFFSKGPSHPRTDSEEVDGGDDADHGKAHLVIPKPDGESSRPGRGGYNLQKVLGWSRKEYANFKVALSLLSAKTDSDNCESRQSSRTWLKNIWIRHKALHSRNSRPSKLWYNWYAFLLLIHRLNPDPLAGKGTLPSDSLLWGQLAYHRPYPSAAHIHIVTGPLCKEQSWCGDREKVATSLWQVVGWTLFPDPNHPINHLLSSSYLFRSASHFVYHSIVFFHRINQITISLFTTDNLVSTTYVIDHRYQCQATPRKKGIWLALKVLWS